MDLANILSLQARGTYGIKQSKEKETLTNIVQQLDKITCVLWLHPVITLAKSRLTPEQEYSFFIFPLIYRKHDQTMASTSVIWLFHPIASLFYRYRSSVGLPTLTWLFPVFFVSSDANEFQLSFAWLFERRCCFIRYLSGNDVLVAYMAFVFYYNRVRSETTKSISSSLLLYCSLIC